MIIQFFLIYFFININECFSFFKKVKLIELTSITLTQRNFTIGREPIPQLSCIGDTFLCHKYSPSTVQCLNRGFDGYDVQWKCKAILSSKVKFKKTIVSCEGYNWPNDHYVIKGSCGLNYSLEYKPDYDSDIKISFKFFWLFIGLFFIIFFILSCLFNYKAKSNNTSENFTTPSAPVLYPGFDSRQHDNPIFWINCESSRDIRQENPPSYDYCINSQNFKYATKETYNANDFVRTQKK